jgi:hypothetical protein
VLAVIVALELRPDLPEIPNPPRPGLRAAEQSQLTPVGGDRFLRDVDSSNTVPRHITGLSREKPHSLA